MKVISKIVFLTALSLFLTGCLSDPVTPPTGILGGNVTLGPLCPVEPCNLSVVELTEIYNNREIIIYELDSTTEVLRYQVDLNKIFLFEVFGGEYILDINYYGMDVSQDVPVKINVPNGESVLFDIDIDTQIR